VAKIAPNITIKVPSTWDGMKACRALSNDGLKVNVTLCFSPVQAMLAAKAGASFISPFIGRVDDVGEDGMGLIRDIRAIYDNYGFKTEILAASIRTVSHVREVALAGADIATIPGEIFKKLMNHPLTDKGLAAFIADAKKANVTIKT
jgi:transaldolase